MMRQQEDFGRTSMQLGGRSALRLPFQENFPSSCPLESLRSPPPPPLSGLRARIPHLVHHGGDAMDSSSMFCLELLLQLAKDAP